MFITHRQTLRDKRHTHSHEIDDCAAVRDESRVLFVEPCAPEDSDEGGKEQCEDDNDEDESQDFTLESGERWGAFG